MTVRAAAAVVNDDFDYIIVVDQVVLSSLTEALESAGECFSSELTRPFHVCGAAHRSANDTAAQATTVETNPEIIWIPDSAVVVLVAWTCIYIGLRHGLLVGGEAVEKDAVRKFYIASKQRHRDRL